MKNIKKTAATSALAMTMALSFGITACSPNRKPDDDSSGYTYRSYTTVSPSNWNLLTQSDNNDRQVSNYLNSSFFEFDFAYDDSGKIIDGGFAVKYSAATKLEDVTSEYAGQYGIEEGTTGNRAWKLTLRSDLKWNDGTQIDANDFVYSMKQTLDPLFMNRLASQFYGSNMIVHNARDYVYAGSSGWFAADSPYTNYTEDLDDKIVFTLGNADENAEKYGGAINSMRSSMGFPASYTAAQVAAYIAKNGFNKPVTASAEDILALEGKTFAEIKADSALLATWQKVIASWQTDPNEELDFFVTNYTYPELSFDEVGFFAKSDLELVVVFDNTFEFLDENGNLTYEAPYYLQDFPLVKEDLYEASKRAPSAGSTLWTSNYGSSVATTASWGPYMLTNYQAGSTYTLSRNENWYGYNMDMYKGQYQTDRIVCRTIPEWETAWRAFQLGEIDDISIDPTIAAQYRTSSQAYYTPQDLVASIHIQSSEEALRNRQTAGVNKTILLQPEFRKALSLAIDRSAYAAAATTSSLAGLGYFNSMHYYDVANGGVYRDTDVAKRALLRAYGAEEQTDGSWKVGDNTYADLDSAEAALTGYNLTLARQLVTSAYEKALAAGDIGANDKVVLTFGTSDDTAASRRHYNFLVDAWTTLMQGTPLEGRFSTEFTTHGDQWANNFRSGQYEIAPASGFSGGAWNPYYMIGAEVDTNESIRYNHGWDTTKDSFEFTMTNAKGEKETYTLSIQDWYDSLNGLDGASYDFSLYPTESRLALVAELEYYALTSYWDIPTFYAFSASLHSYKMEFATYEYNTFLGYGDIRFMTYNYTDAEWTSYVSSQGGNLNYAK